MASPDGPPLASPPPRAERRRHWRGLQIVDGFHLRFVLNTLLYIGLILLTSTALVFLGPVIELLYGGTSDRTRVAADQLLWLHAAVWPALVLVLVAMGAVLVATSHRIAGPLVRFKRVFAAVRDGRLPARVRLRRGDFLTTEAAVLEGMLDAQRRFHEELHGRVASVLDAATRLHAAAHAAPMPLERLTGDLVAELADLDAFVHRVQLEDDAPAPVLVVPTSSPPRQMAGFTVLELLVTCALVGVVMAMAAPRYVQALEIARVTRAVADIKAIEKEVLVYRVLNGCFPRTLADVDRGGTVDPWGRPYQYQALSEVRLAGLLGAADPGAPVGTAGPPKAPGGGSAGGGGAAPGPPEGVGGGPPAAVGPPDGVGPPVGVSPFGSGACGAVLAALATARKDRNLIPLNSDFDLFSKGKDGQSLPPITAPVSQDDVLRANNGGFVNLASKY